MKSSLAVVSRESVKLGAISLPDLTPPVIVTLGIIATQEAHRKPCVCVRTDAGRRLIYLPCESVSVLVDLSPSSAFQTVYQTSTQQLIYFYALQSTPHPLPDLHLDLDDVAIAATARRHSTGAG